MEKKIKNPTMDEWLEEQDLIQAIKLAEKEIEHWKKFKNDCEKRLKKIK
ncbi:MAG: hypothetical protein WCR65_02480 [Parcubacteria group bacterium]